MRKTSQITIGVVIGLLSAVVVLGGVAFATMATPADFAPFTMRVTYWTSTALQREGAPPQAGTAVSLLEYRGVDQWKVTVISSTWDPGAVGTVVEVKNGEHSTFIAQARRLVSRVIPQSDAGRMGPYRWIQPGVVNSLPQQGFLHVPTSSGAVAAFVERGASTVPRADGTVDVLAGTIAEYDLASGLPRSVRTYHGGVLSESLQFDVIGTP